MNKTISAVLVIASAFFLVLSLSTVEAEQDGEAGGGFDELARYGRSNDLCSGPERCRTSGTSGSLPYEMEITRRQCAF